MNAYFCRECGTRMSPPANTTVLADDKCSACSPSGHPQHVSEDEAARAQEVAAAEAEAKKAALAAAEAEEKAKAAAEAEAKKAAPRGK